MVDLLNVQQLAIFLGVTINTIHNLTRKRRQLDADPNRLSQDRQAPNF